MNTLFSRLSKINLFTLNLPFYIRYSVSIVFVYIAYIVKILFLSFSNQGVFSIFYVAITVAAWLGGIGPAIFATILSIFVVDFFFLLPEYGSSLTHPHNIRMIVVYFLEGMLITLIVGFMHRYMSEFQEKYEALEISERKFKQLYDSNLIGIIFWGVDGTIYEANDEFLQMLNYTQADLKSHAINWMNLTPPEYKQQDTKALTELRIKGSCTPYLKEYYRKDGSKIHVLISAAMLRESDHEGIAYILDMTEEKKAEQQTELFIGFVSHELKNPLSSVKAYTQLLKKHLIKLNHEKEVSFATKVEEKIVLLTRLLNDMLDITKLRAGKLTFIDEEFNLQKSIQNLVEDMQKTTSTHTIFLEGVIQTPMCADKMRILQIVTNVLSNAIKYSPRAKEIKVSLREEGNNAYVTVQDFGLGISNKDQKNIFEPLYRAGNLRSRSLPGTGLGLYITAEIVRHYKGSIHLKSNVGKGTTVTIALPLKKV